MNDGETPTWIHLSLPEQQIVEEIMKLGGFNKIQEAVRRAIVDELFLLRQREQGWTIFMRKGYEDKELAWFEGEKD